MPKNPLRQLGRRKSSGNVLDIAVTPESTPPIASASVPSFRVLERVDQINGKKSPAPPPRRPFSSPRPNPRGREVEELGGALNKVDGDDKRGLNVRRVLKSENRASAGTTISTSSDYHDSSAASPRYSFISTRPSSVDVDHDEELAQKPKRPPITTDFDSPSKSFTSRAARAFSFGNKFLRHDSAPAFSFGNKVVRQDSAPAAPAEVPPIPPIPPHSHSPAHRPRAVTESSYASTTKPEQLNLNPGDFGGDFGSMFDGVAKQALPQMTPPPPARHHPHATVRRETRSEMPAVSLTDPPLFRPPGASRRSSTIPSPPLFHERHQLSGSPYSCDERDGLMSTSVRSSPRIASPPQVPPHQSGIAPAFLASSRSGYSLVSGRTDRNPTGLRAADTISGADEVDEYPSGDDDDDDEPRVKRFELRDPQELPHMESLSATSSQTARMPSLLADRSTRLHQEVMASGPEGSLMGPTVSAGSSIRGAASSNATPRPSTVEVRGPHEDSLFDSSPRGPSPREPPSRVVRPASQLPPPAANLKRMTVAQFETLQRGGGNHDAQSDDDEYEDVDEAERVTELARHRRKQEATLSLYRQQMKKVTGGTAGSAAALPSMSSRASMDPGGVYLGGTAAGAPPPDTTRATAGDDDDDNDDIPLGILQAHGFPATHRPPARRENDFVPASGRASVAGSVVGGGGGSKLPPFARRLPTDPYFGAGLVSPPARESMAFGGGAQHGPGGMGLHPGGLVGVIAGEERAKAARRASPHTAGYGYGYPPSQHAVEMMPPSGYANATAMGGGGGFGGGMPMMSPGMGPMVNMPGMPQMPQTPGLSPEQHMQQMQQFMQMQMQMMQNMFGMQQPHPHLQVPGAAPPAPSLLGPPHLRPTGPTAPRPLSTGSPYRLSHPHQQQQLRPRSAVAYPPAAPAPAPSIAPTERTNIGQPSRYRPVDLNVNARPAASVSGAARSGRAPSLSSQAMFPSAATPPPPPPPPAANRHGKAARTSKGALRAGNGEEGDEDGDGEGWAEMARARQRRQSRWGRKTGDAEDAAALGRLWAGGE